MDGTVDVSAVVRILVVIAGAAVLGRYWEWIPALDRVGWVALYGLLLVPAMGDLAQVWPSWDWYTLAAVAVLGVVLCLRLHRRALLRRRTSGGE